MVNELLQENLQSSMYDLVERISAVRKWAHDLSEKIETTENFPISKLADFILIQTFVKGMQIAQISHAVHIPLEEIRSIFIETTRYLLEDSKKVLGIDINLNILIQEYLIIRARTWVEESGQFELSRGLSENSGYTDYHLRDLAGHGKVISIHTDKGWFIAPKSLQEYRRGPETRGRPRRTDKRD